MAITDTKHGVLWLESKDDIFTIRLNDGKPPLYQGDEAGALKFVADAYVIDGDTPKLKDGEHVFVSDVESPLWSSTGVIRKVEKPTKLSNSQREIIGLMRDGWTLAEDTDKRGKAYIQKGGIGKGGESLDVNSKTVNALYTQKIIRITKQSFPTNEYALTKLGQSINTSGEDVLEVELETIASDALLSGKWHIGDKVTFNASALQLSPKKKIAARKE